MSEKEAMEQSSRKVLWWTIGGTLAFFAIGLIVIVFFDATSEEKARFGDSMNVLTALFSSLALAAVLASLWYQHRELAQTIEEMKVSNATQAENLERQAEIAEAMRMQAEALYRPYVSLRLATGKSDRVFLVVENFGRSPARNLRLAMSKDAFIPDAINRHYDFRGHTLFNSGVATFAPSQVVRVPVALGVDINMHERSEASLPLTYQIAASYGWGAENQEYENWVIDLGLYSTVDAIE